MKRSRNDFSPDNNSNLSIKRQKFTYNSDVSFVINPFQNNSIDIKQHKKKKSKGFYNLMINKKEKKESSKDNSLIIINKDNNNKQDNKFNVKEYPFDRTLKTKIRIVSSSPFSWFSSSYNNINISKECYKFRKASSYFCFPSSISFPSEFQQLYTQHKVSNKSSPIIEYFNTLKKQWIESFTSAYITLIQDKSCNIKRFYCYFEKYCIVIEKNNNEIFAIISPSSKGLRWKLKCKNIYYSLPFDYKNGILYYDSLEPDQISQLDKERYEQSALTQLIIKDNDNISQLIDILVDSFTNEYLELSFYLPKIISFYSFTHSSNILLDIVSCGKLTRTIGNKTNELYRIELSGDILPDNIKYIYKYINKYHNDSFEIILSTHNSTKSFNIPQMQNNNSNSKLKEDDCLFLSKINTSPQLLYRFKLDNK